MGEVYRTIVAERGRFRGENPRIGTELSDEVTCALISIDENDVTEFWMHIGELRIRIDKYSDVQPTLLDILSGDNMVCVQTQEFGSLYIHLLDNNSFEKFWRAVREVLVEILFMEATSVWSTSGRISVPVMQSAIEASASLVPSTNVHVLRGAWIIKCRRAIDACAQALRADPGGVSVEVAERVLQAADSDPVFSSDRDVQFIRYLLPSLYPRAQDEVVTGVKVTSPSSGDDVVPEESKTATPPEGFIERYVTEDTSEIDSDYSCSSTSVWKCDLADICVSYDSDRVALSTRHRSSPRRRRRGLWLLSVVLRSLGILVLMISAIVCGCMAGVIARQEVFCLQTHSLHSIGVAPDPAQYSGPWTPSPVLLQLPPISLLPSRVRGVVGASLCSGAHIVINNPSVVATFAAKASADVVSMSLSSMYKVWQHTLLPNLSGWVRYMYQQCIFPLGRSIWYQCSILVKGSGERLLSPTSAKAYCGEELLPWLKRLLQEILQIAKKRFLRLDFRSSGIRIYELLPISSATDVYRSVVHGRLRPLIVELARVGLGAAGQSWRVVYSGYSKIARCAHVFVDQFVSLVYASGNASQSDSESASDSMSTQELYTPDRTVAVVDSTELFGTDEPLVKFAIEDQVCDISDGCRMMTGHIIDESEGEEPKQLHESVHLEAAPAGVPVSPTFNFVDSGNPDTIGSLGHDEFSPDDDEIDSGRRFVLGAIPWLRPRSSVYHRATPDLFLSNSPGNTGKGDVEVSTEGSEAARREKSKRLHWLGFVRQGN